MPKVERVADETHKRHRAPRKQRAVHEGIGLRGDEEYGPGDRNERDPAGMPIFCAVKRHGAGNEDESQKARCVSYPKGQTPEVKESECFDSGKENAGAEFPKACKRKVERCREWERRCRTALQSQGSTGAGVAYEARLR